MATSIPVMPRRTLRSQPTANQGSPSDWRLRWSEAQPNGALCRPEDALLGSLDLYPEIRALLASTVVLVPELATQHKAVSSLQQSPDLPARVQFCVCVAVGLSERGLGGHGPMNSRSGADARRSTACGQVSHRRPRPASGPMQTSHMYARRMPRRRGRRRGACARSWRRARPSAPSSRAAHGSSCAFCSFNFRPVAGHVIEPKWQQGVMNDHSCSISPEIVMRFDFAEQTYLSLHISRLGCHPTTF